MSKSVDIESNYNNSAQQKKGIFSGLLKENNNNKDKKDLLEDEFVIVNTKDDNKVTQTNEGIILSHISFVCPSYISSTCLFIQWY